MKVTVQVGCPDGGMEVWDTKLTEVSVLLIMTAFADKPEVLKMTKQNFL